MVKLICKKLKMYFKHYNNLWFWNKLYKYIKKIIFITLFLISIAHEIMQKYLHFLRELFKINYFKNTILKHAVFSLFLYRVSQLTWESRENSLQKIIVVLPNFNGKNKVTSVRVYYVNGKRLFCFSAKHCMMFCNNSAR